MLVERRARSRCPRCRSASASSAPASSASRWAASGAGSASEVTVLEALPVFLGAVDGAVAKEAAKAFAKQGLAIHTGAAISKVAPGKDDVTVEWKDAKGEARKRRLRPADRLDRPRAAHRGPRRRHRRSRARREGLRRRRRRLPHEPRRRLGDRRRRAWPDARAQGRGRGRGGGRAHRRAEAAHRLRHDSLGRSTPRPRSPGSDATSSSSRPTASPSRRAPSRSWRTVARARSATRPAS